MIWRVWSFTAGLPVGALAGWAAKGPPPSAAAVELGALAGGLLLATAVSLIGRHDDRARGAHLAAAASAGLVALPGLGASLLDLAPGPRWWLGATLLLLALSLFRGSRHLGPSGGMRRQVVAAVGFAFGGATAIAVVSGVLAACGVDDPPFDERRAAAIYDLDATVVTRPLPRCAASPRRVEVLLERGARPRLGPEGHPLWFDAADGEGRRQVHRLDRATGEVACWTCGEAGNNWRPAPGEGGASIVFVTDRQATWWAPANTEIHLIGTRGRAPPMASRQLTHSPGADDHPLLVHGARRLVWSQREGGRYSVVSASIRSVHGGLLLGREALIAAGGAQWTAALAWSPDARSLVVVRGNPFRPSAARGIDFATGRSAELGGDVAGGGAAAFNADGGWVGVASARRDRLLGFLPAEFGFLLGPLAARAERREPVFRGTGVRTGEPWGEGGALELGELAVWGEPTGIALTPAGTELILGQRRTRRGRVEERLVEIVLDCAEAASGA